MLTEICDTIYYLVFTAQHILKRRDWKMQYYDVLVAERLYDDVTTKNHFPH